jgi:hypothetical protein
MAEWEKWNRENEQKKTLDFYAARANYASAPRNFGRPPGEAATQYTADKHFMSQFDKPSNPYSPYPTLAEHKKKLEEAALRQAAADQAAIDKIVKEREAASGQAKGGGRKRHRNRTSRRSRSRTSRRSRSRTSRRSRSHR